MMEHKNSPQEKKKANCYSLQERKPIPSESREK